ncbi:MAG: FtsX-like permease family protein [Thermoleophilia bacterium]|jgi:lipoprotein-releasing system permease protein|nr:FtsX-like permease family protein [Thermoleophilia bacterium]
MLSLRIAARFLSTSPAQSGLIAAGIAFGIGVQVFLGSLIISLQASLVDETIGSSPQITVVSASEGAAVVYTDDLAGTLEGQPQVTTVVPTRAYSAIFTRGDESAPLQVTGGELERLDTIYALSERVVDGEPSLDAGEVMVGREFAAQFELGPGDEVTLVRPDGEADTATITAVVDFGAAAANRSLAFADAAAAADVLGQAPDEYTAVQLQVDDVFDSVAIAEQLAAEPALEGLEVTEWQADNEDLLSALQAQSSSSYTIQFFVLVAVALGIASTLAISAVQKTRQIGILKAMGMQDRGTGRIFFWQAVVLGTGGAAAGVVLGVALIVVFAEVSTTIDLSPQWGFTAISFAVGVAVAMLSSIIPARRTTRLDPIEVIQGG